MISTNQYILIALIGALGFLIYLFLEREAGQKATIQEQDDALQGLRLELSELRKSLEYKDLEVQSLNKQLATEVEERENKEAYVFSRDKFLANTSTAMRKPLDRMNELTHRLLKEKLREDQLEALRNIQFAANDLLVLINDILRFSKIEAGKIELQEREFNLEDTLRQAASNMEQTAREKGLLFHMEFDSKIPSQLLGDPARLIQIFTTLLSKVISHTEEGMVDVLVGVENPKWTNVNIKLTISATDNGLGLEWMQESPENQPAELELESGYDSQLMPFALAKRLIELQNGSLEVESRASLGSAFIVSLPFKNLGVEKARAKAMNIQWNDYTHLAGTRVLVVEDNPINQLVVANMLRKLGFEVTTANNGLLALEAFEKATFDLILMDIQMPEMDGYRTTAEIRRHTDPVKNEVPIIALTASAYLSATDRAKLFGMNAHVGKPFSPEELLGKINACLEFCK